MHLQSESLFCIKIKENAKRSSIALEFRLSLLNLGIFLKTSLHEIIQFLIEIGKLELNETEFLYYRAILLFFNHFKILEVLPELFALTTYPLFNFVDVMLLPSLLSFFKKSTFYSWPSIRLPSKCNDGFLTFFGGW